MTFLWNFCLQFRELQCLACKTMVKSLFCRHMIIYAAVGNMWKSYKHIWLRVCLKTRIIRDTVTS